MQSKDGLVEITPSFYLFLGKMRQNN